MIINSNCTEVILVAVVSVIVAVPVGTMPMGLSSMIRAAVAVMAMLNITGCNLPRCAHVAWDC